MTIREKLDYIIEKSGVKVNEVVIDHNLLITCYDLLCYLYNNIDKLHLKETFPIITKNQLIVGTINWKFDNDEILWINLVYKIMKKHETIHES